jgi:hypothetical protein
MLQIRTDRAKKPKVPCHTEIHATSQEKRILFRNLSVIFVGGKGRLLPKVN